MIISDLSFILSFRFIILYPLKFPLQHPESVQPDQRETMSFICAELSGDILSPAFCKHFRFRGKTQHSRFCVIRQFRRFSISNINIFIQYFLYLQHRFISPYKQPIGLTPSYFFI